MRGHRLFVHWNDTLVVSVVCVVCMKCVMLMFCVVLVESGEEMVRVRAVG